MIESPHRGLGPLIILVGGLAAAAINAAGDRGSLALIIIGIALALAGKADRAHRWMLPMGLPLAAVGCGLTAAALVPFFQAHLSPLIFAVVGISIIAADSLAAPGRAWTAALAILALTTGLILVAVGSPNASAVIPGWALGASLAVLALAVAATERLPPKSVPRERFTRTVLRDVPAPRTMFVRGALLFAGGVGVSLVDQVDRNLYEVVAAFGIAYLVPGVITNQRRWAERGMMLTALGAVIVSTDFIPSAATYIYGLVFAAIAAAMLLVQIFSLGRIRGIGRSLIAISIFLFVLSVLPDTPPLGPIGKNIDALLPLLPAGTGIVLLVRAWLGSGGLRPHQGTQST